MHFLDPIEMKATILISRQEEMREKERERARSSEEERERQEGERTGGRGSKLTTRARRCVPEGIITRIYSGDVQLASAWEYPSVLFTAPFQPVLSGYPVWRVITGGSGSGSCTLDPSSHHLVGTDTRIGPWKKCFARSKIRTMKKYFCK
jgi:hypothetical protein